MNDLLEVRKAFRDVPARPQNECALIMLLGIRNWNVWIQKYTDGRPKAKMLIGAKCDSGEKREVSTEDGMALAEELGVPFLETSAKQSIGIEEMFVRITEEINGTQKVAPTPAAGGSQAAVGKSAPENTNGPRTKVDSHDFEIDNSALTPVSRRHEEDDERCDCKRRECASTC